ncbi:hypothetical protein [Marinomonas sp. 2405UD68-3]|uniref:hypothetical protein n=1 Tax=Marinomonas sp. 2405UD68-3 TaxID=3391835 RepID=UPI0039C9F5D2
MKNIFIIFVVFLLGCTEKVTIGERPFLWEVSISDDWIMDDISEKNILKIHNDTYEVIAGITLNEISTIDQLDYWKKIFKSEIYQQSIGTMDVSFDVVEVPESDFNAIDVNYIRVGLNEMRVPANVKSRFYYYSEAIEDNQYSITFSVRLKNKNSDFNFNFSDFFKRVD